MCGITGIITNRPKKYNEELAKMMASIKHRGPDGDGVYFAENCSLGHVRLSIVDLISGQQPMLLNNQGGALVFNGEIYGYQDLRKKITNYNFKTKSDTELIMALYETDGEKFVNKLPGMFSFALWDERQKLLLCARDRFGEKPFYYAIGDEGEFIFASEIKAIVDSQLLKPIIDQENLAYYLKKLCVPANKTIYKNIYTLAAGHYLIYKNKKITIKKYWEFPKIITNIKLDEAQDQLHHLLKESVKKQLIADVPVGAFLSGGIDSSLIVALAKNCNQDIKTFSFAFNNHTDELSYARLIANTYQTQHTELFANESEIAEVLLNLHKIYDEPFADSSAVPTYLISHLASQYTKVALTGDGGDELFGGYNWYQNLLNFSPDNKNLLTEYTNKIIGKIIAKSTNNKKNIFTQKGIGYRLSRLFDNIISAHNSQLNYFSDQELKNLGLNIPQIYKPDWQINNNVDDALQMDIKEYMPADILKKTDRAAMACGLELRAPFLDQALAEFAISLPYQLKLNYQEQKIMLKETFKKQLPSPIIKRSKKGFGAPVNKWLKMESINNIKNEYLLDKNKYINQIFDRKIIQSISAQDNYQTWAMLVLSIWLENNKYEIK